MAGVTQWFERDRPLKFRVWNGHEFTDECSLIMGMDGAEVFGIGLRPQDMKIQIGTGCLDMAGKEIFEGDYFMTNEGDWVAAVVFGYGYFWCLDEDGGFSYSVEWEKGLVVGNVFEGIDEELVEAEAKRRNDEEKRRHLEEMGESMKSWINRKKQG